MASTEQLRAWSHHRQRLGKTGSTAKEVLDEVIGVYSTHPCGPLSLKARLPELSAETFQQLDADHSTARLPAMRGSVHQVPAVSASRIFSACLPSPESDHWEKRYSQDGRKIPPADYPAWCEEILALTTTPFTVKELKTMIETVPADKLKFVLNRMGYEGQLVRLGATGLKSNTISYVNAKTWLGSLIKWENPEEALSWLAKEYLRAFGPARRKDFQWWAGVTATRAKAALASIELVELGSDYLILPEDEKAFKSFVPQWDDTLDILPQWDCYTMGYAPDGRQRFVNDEHHDFLYGKLGATLGNGLGTMLHNGHSIGIWASRFKGTTMEANLYYYGKTEARIKKRVATELEVIGSWLGAKKVVFDVRGLS